MIDQPKLILLGGAAGIGKTTIGRRYAAEKPLTLCLETDNLISMISGWQDNEAEARQLVFEDLLAIVRVHLAARHDVVLPYLLTDAKHAAAFEKVTEECGADFIEIMLEADKTEAVRRLYARGSWGEADAPPLTDADRPIVEELYDTMIRETAKRPKTIHVAADRGHINVAYRRFVEIML